MTAPSRYDARNGIDYYGAETLNVKLGSGDDVVDVQGTRDRHEPSTGGGDDGIYVWLAGERDPRQVPEPVTGHARRHLGAL